jgi:hypothetical protein
MQQFTYAGYTIYHAGLPYDATPIGLGRQADGILALVCRPPEAVEALLWLLEVQGCADCRTLQWHDGRDEACFRCGGALEWAEWHHWIAAA